MLTNDILRRLRFAVRVDDAAMLEMLRLGGSNASAASLAAFLSPATIESLNQVSADSMSACGLY